MGTILPSTSGAMITGAIGMLASFIPYEKRVYDVSACGTRMMFRARKLEEDDSWSVFSKGDGDGIITIEHFANDKAPFSFEPLQRKQTSSSYNGKLIFFNDSPLLKFSVSVIPNTKEDSALSDFFNKSSFGDYHFDAMDMVIDMCISQERLEQSASNAKWPIGDKAKSKVYNVGFYGGVIESGPPGSGEKGLAFSASTEGRLESHTYSFVFSPNRGDQFNSWVSEPKKTGFLQSIADKFTKG